MSNDLFEVTYRDRDGELLVGVAPDEHAAMGLIVRREALIYFCELESAGEPLPEDGAEVEQKVAPRVRVALPKYAMRRLG